MSVSVFVSQRERKREREIVSAKKEGKVGNETRMKKERVKI
jgi:hypothetical protein